MQINKKYSYARVSSKSQESNSSIEFQAINSKCNLRQKDSSQSVG